MKKLLIAATLLVGAIAVLYAQEPQRFERGLEIIRGNILMAGTAGNRVCYEGATADAFELCLAASDVTADVNLTLPLSNAADGAVVISTLTTNSPQVANSVWMTSGGIVFEGATADANEITLTVTDPAADSTFTLPASGTWITTTLGTNDVDVANSVWGVSNALTAEGATADGFELTLTWTDPTADMTVTFPNFAVNYAVVGSTLTTNNVDAANSIWLASNGIVLEGATANAFEMTVSPADVGADVTVTLPAMGNAAWAAVGSTLTTNDVDAANAIWFGTASIISEGATADAGELTLSFPDVVDITVTVPSFGGVSYALVGSTLTTNNVDVANSVWHVSNGIIFEGATADLSELTLSATDPTADMTVTLPNFAVNYAVMGSTLATNNVDAANSIWFVSNGMVLEGATADAFEMTVSPADVGADETVTLPGMGNVSWAAVGSTLTTNDAEAANSIWFSSNTINFEGATANGFELTISLTDPTADMAVTLPNFAVSYALVGSTLVTNSVDIANSIWLASNAIVFEGATADGNEAQIQFVDPGADGTLLFTIAGQVAGEQLQTDGAGTLTWEAAGSLRAFKNLEGLVSPAEGLRAMLSAPVYRFHYKHEEGATTTGDYETQYVGVLGDEAPWAMHFGGRILNPVNTFGYTVLAIQAQQARIEDLETRLAALEARR